MHPSFCGWGYSWRPFDLVSFVLLDINTKINLRLQSQRDSKTAATVGVLRVPPEKPRPPMSGNKYSYLKPVLVLITVALSSVAPLSVKDS